MLYLVLVDSRNTKLLAIGGIAVSMPQYPEFADLIASIEKVRVNWMHRSSSYKVKTRIFSNGVRSGKKSAN